MENIETFNTNQYYNCKSCFFSQSNGYIHIYEYVSIDERLDIQEK